MALRFIMILFLNYVSYHVYIFSFCCVFFFTLCKTNAFPVINEFQYWRLRTTDGYIWQVILEKVQNTGRHLARFSNWIIVCSNKSGGASTSLLLPASWLRVLAAMFVSCNGRALVASQERPHQLGWSEENSTFGNGSVLRRARRSLSVWVPMES
jgi:hypothetical protein